MPLTDPTTFVPAAQLTDAGFNAPSEQDILTGRLNDFNAALGGNINTALNTPQGQIALSDTAILGDALAAMLAVFNGIDPATTSGRMQEAIGRIYFIERRPAISTTVTVQAIVSAPYQVITAGSIIAASPEGLQYALVSDAPLPDAETVNLDLACTTPGAVACPARSLQLYQGGIGLASLTNPTPGAMGRDVENRADFETRRQASVAGNSIGQNASLMGALLALDGVTDAYVHDNPTGSTTTVNGVDILPHSIYVLVEGGQEHAIGQAILAKKPPGIATTGARFVTVKDTNPAYSGNDPLYTFRYDRPTPTPVTVSVTLEKSDAVPSDADRKVNQAIMNVLKTGRSRARLGGTLYASRFSAAIDGLGDWAEVLSLTLSTDTQPQGQTRLRLPLNQLPVITPDTIRFELI